MLFIMGKLKLSIKFIKIRQYDNRKQETLCYLIRAGQTSCRITNFAGVQSVP